MAKKPTSANGAKRNTTTVHVAVPNCILQVIRRQANLQRRSLHAQLALLLELGAAVWETRQIDGGQPIGG